MSHRQSERASQSQEEASKRAALPFVPPVLVGQLAEDGRLVQPIGPGGDEIIGKFQARREAREDQPGRKARDSSR
jgi:protein-L-isoaspartate O-methyltransferase